MIKEIEKSESESILGNNEYKLYKWRYVSLTLKICSTRGLHLRQHDCLYHEHSMVRMSEGNRNSTSLLNLDL